MKSSMVVVALIALAASAQTPPAPLEHEQVGVSLRLQATDPGGGVTRSGSGDAGLAPGERASVYVAVSPGLCSVMTGGSAGGLGEFEPDGWVEHLWWADVELLDSGLEEIVLRIDWKRLDRAGDDLAISNGGTREVTLREGQTHMLDFIPEPQRDRGQVCYQNVLVDLTAKVREDPELATESLRYDVWFIDESPEGNRTAHLSTLSKQGEPVGIRFEPLRWRVAEGVFDGEKDADLVLELSGRLRGRLRRDGSVDVELAASRWLGVAPEDGSRPGGIGDGGRKVFSVTLGETVKMVLPDPGSNGSHALRRTDDGHGQALMPPSRGVVLTDEWIQVQNAPFFEGHEMSLLLTVTQ